MTKHTVAHIQKSMSAFDTFARGHQDPKSLQTKWNQLFDSALDTKAANAFVTYYRKMKKNTRKNRQSGGVAPLDYAMTPGANVSVYGKFPVAVDTDQASIRDLDVYFHDALTRDCGNPAQAAAFPHPSSEMGSNQAGGKKSRRNRRNRKTARKNSRKGNRKNRQTQRNRRQRGGSLLASLGYHPYLSTVPPSLIQTGANAWNGGTAPLPFPGTPTSHQWQYVSNGIAGTIDPGLVTPIGTKFATLATIDPWQTAQ